MTILAFVKFSSNGGVFKTVNGGKSWKAVNTGVTKTDVRFLAIDPTDSRIVYAGTWGGGLFIPDLRRTVDACTREAGGRESVIVIIAGHVTVEMFDRRNTIARDDAQPYSDCGII